MQEISTTKVFLLEENVYVTLEKIGEVRKVDWVLATEAETSTSTQLANGKEVTYKIRLRENEYNDWSIRETWKEILEISYMVYSQNQKTWTSGYVKYSIDWETVSIAETERILF